MGDIIVTKDRKNIDSIIGELLGDSDNTKPYNKLVDLIRIAREETVNWVIKEIFELIDSEGNINFHKCIDMVSSDITKRAQTELNTQWKVK